MIGGDMSWSKTATHLGYTKAVSGDEECSLAARFVNRSLGREAFDVLLMLGLEDHWERG